MKTIIKTLIAAPLAFCAALATIERADAATLVVNHDEWTLSNSGFSAAPDAAQFVANLVAEFGTTLHAYSTNFGFTGSSLASAMSIAGATYTTGTGFAFTLANLSAYDGLFLGGDYLTAGELGVLSSYIAGGGNVYIAGGTGAGGPAGEAAAWNSFLAPFNVQMGSPYNGVSGNTAVSGDPLFAGVAELFSNNGNPLSGSSVVCCAAGGQYAVTRAAVVPLPASLPMLTLAVGLLGWRASRKT